MYTIGQISEMYGIPVSTLRYYDREGFFPEMQRKGNVRCFTDKEREALRVIECLKMSGLEIKEIRQFFRMVSEGSSSYPQRKALFEERRKAILEEMERLEKTLAMAEFKCWYYGRAMEDGNEDSLSAMLPDKLPEDIQKLYDRAHE